MEAERTRGKLGTAGSTHSWEGPEWNPDDEEKEVSRS
jgi:hypothetical protein